jgi:hypothetical protein
MESYTCLTSRCVSEGTSGARTGEFGSERAYFVTSDSVLSQDSWQTGRTL